MPAALGLGEIEQQAIDSLGLKRIDASELTIERVACGNGFQFLREGRRAVGRRHRVKIRGSGRSSGGAHLAQRAPSVGQLLLVRR